MLEILAKKFEKRFILYIKLEILAIFNINNAKFK